MTTALRGRRWATRSAACLAGTGLLLGIAAPASAADSVEVPAQPPATSAGLLQAALDRPQQDVYDAQANLDAAKTAEAQAYADLESLTSTALEEATVALGVVVAAKAALEAATELYEAAKKAQDEGQENITQLQAAVAAAQADVDRTKVDGEAALEKVAEDYATRVLPAEADKVLRCAINKNSPARKDATARLAAAQEAHERFAAPLRAAADAYANALTALADAEVRLRLAQSEVGDLAVEALEKARDAAQQAYEDAQRSLIDLVVARAEAIAAAGVAIGEAEVKTEIRRQALRAAKAMLAELIAHNDFEIGDGSHLDDSAVTPEDVTAGNDGGNDNMAVAPDPDDPLADNGSDLDNMGSVTPERPTPEPTPTPTPPTAVKPATTHKVVYLLKKGTWHLHRGHAAGMPATAVVTVKAPAKGTAAVKKARAKAKRIALKHKATFAGTTYSPSVKRARVIATWATAG